MKQFYIKISEIEEVLYLKAEELEEINEHLYLFKDNKCIGTIKGWICWAEVFE